MTQNLIPLASPVNTTVTMTSRELVDFINNHRKAQAEGSGYAFPSKGFAKLQHKDFLAKVPEVLGAETSAKFSANLPDTYGRLQPAYRFPKREATLMAMSYSYALQAAVYDHMTALEAKTTQPAFQIPATLSAALRLAAEQAEQIERQQEQLAIAAPKVEFVDRYVESTGNKCFRTVAKLLEAKESALRAFLQYRGVMYLLDGEWMAYSQHHAAGRFVVKTGSRNGHSFAQTLFTPKGVQWIADQWAKHQLPETETLF